MTDLGDAKEVKRAKRQHKNKATIAREELVLILKQQEVRNFIWTLLEDCGINAISFRGEATHETAFNEGARNVGNKLIARLDDAQKHTYMKIYTENRKDVKKDG